MRDVVWSIVVMACALAVSGVAVFMAHDTSTLVPPPESTAEDFARELSQRRYAIAWRQLSSGARKQESEAELRAQFDPVIAELGKINAVDAREIASGGDTATATSRIDGSERDILIMLTLTRENGLWMVERWHVAGRVD